MPARALQQAPQGLPESAFSHPGTGSRDLLVVFQGRSPFIRLLLGDVFRDSVAFLDTSDQLVAPTSNDFDIIIGQLPPLFAGLAHHLFPVTFYSVPIHFGTSDGGECSHPAIESECT